ncbi:hypothetical protein YC2023_011307 [Brassica napus]
MEFSPDSELSSSRKMGNQKHCQGNNNHLAKERQLMFPLRNVKMTYWWCCWDAIEIRWLIDLDIPFGN